MGYPQVETKLMYLTPKADRLCFHVRISWESASGQKKPPDCRVRHESTLEEQIYRKGAVLASLTKLEGFIHALFGAK